MATNGCSLVIFLGSCKNAFYFDVGETDVDQDLFTLSEHQHSKHKLQSKDNKFLLLNADGQFEVRHLSISEQRNPDCKFTIHIYTDSALEGRKGRAVMLYTSKDGKKMVACCSEKNEIYPEAMDPPHKIEETAHKALFYLTKLSASNQYMFESSVYPCKFLGFEPDKDNPSLKKLVLLHKGHDEVDDACEVTVSDCNA
uniref:Interleukin-18 n=1 Tax=Lates calcarifer TaxID=8187 RepID=A0A4W6BXU0_LATCA